MSSYQAIKYLSLVDEVNRRDPHPECSELQTKVSVYDALGSSICVRENKMSFVPLKIRFFKRLFLSDCDFQILLPVCTEIDMDISTVAVSVLKMFFEFLSVLVTSGKLIWISNSAAEGPTFSLQYSNL